MITDEIATQEANKPHLVTQDAMTSNAHVLPMELIKDLSNGTQNLKHLSEKEQSVIVRCLANAVVELSKPAPKPKHEPVGYVKTVGGYPDESEHKVEWVVKYKELKHGQPLYTSPPTREPLSDDERVDLVMEYMRNRLIGSTMDVLKSFELGLIVSEQAHGIGVTK